MFPLKFQVITTLVFFIQAYGLPVDQEEQEAEKYLQEIEEPLSNACFKEVQADFNHAADMKEETSQAKEMATKEATDVRQKIQREIMDRFKNWKDYKNEDIRYQVKYLHSSGPANMSIDLVKKMVSVQAEITKLRASAKICDWINKTDCSLTINPEIQHKLKSSAKERNLAAAEYYWTEGHNKVGKAVRPEKYQEFVNLSNIFAVANDYANMMDFWLSEFDDHADDFCIERFESDLQKTLDEFMPYYQKLHAYVRMKLKKKWGDSLKLPENGYLTFPIFGTMFGNDWSLVATETKPFPDTKEVKFDEALVEAGYTPTKIIEVAENFFTSLNEEWKLPKSLWEKSLFERPEDNYRAVSCHPVAYDFCVKNDFRLHMCIKVNGNNLKVAYHELGHIFYFMEYQRLPIAFRAGANPGFHEAIGDTISLSVTPKHLKCVLKLNIEAYHEIECGNGKEADTHPIDHNDINVLYQSALAKLPGLPFGLSVDLWRTKVFKGEISPAEYNAEWWKIREQLQGMVPPSARPPDNLDPMVLFHMAANIPYIIYFTSSALQFQFYEAMCIAAKQYDPNDPKHTAPLHRCDFSNSKEAGKLLKEVLRQGASRDWKSVLYQFTGSREISLRPLIHYYQPLFDHIDKELKENNFPACFGKDCKQ